jgi:hypothetical protein
LDAGWAEYGDTGGFHRAGKMQPADGNCVDIIWKINLGDPARIAAVSPRYVGLGSIKGEVYNGID